MGAKRGGMSRAALDMCRSLAQAGLSITLATTDDNGAHERLPVPLGTTYNANGYDTIYFARQTLPYGISQPLLFWLNSQLRARKFDMVHVHGVFSFASDVPALVARIHGVPYVITPHGILCKWGMQHRRPALKQLFVRMLVGPNLEGAALLHFTTEMEECESRGSTLQRKFKNEVVLPYCLDLDLTHSRALNELPDVFTLLFLSRIDPKKGLEITIESLSELVRDSLPVRLLIAGNGEPTYISKLKTLAERLNVARYIEWVGFADEAMKHELFAKADIFVLPTFSENFGIAPIEALAAGVPVVIAEGAAVSKKLLQTQAALVVQSTAQSVANAIRQVINSPELRQSLRSNGLQVVRDYYASPATVERWLALYKNICNVIS